MTRTIPVALALLLASALSPAALGAEAPTTISVTVPDYEVERVGDFDEVTIPGGGQLMVEEGRPQVPYYNTVVEYPAGYRIQEVTLTGKTGEKTDSGLVLATVELNTYGQELARPKPPKPGVYPLTDYGWEAVYSHDRSATLVVSVFPFSYNPTTHRSTFYKEYTFEVEHIKTGVSITEAHPTQTNFEPGARAQVLVKLANQDEPQDVLVKATVRKAFTLDKVADIPAKTVSGLGRTDSVLLEWPTRGRASGDYTFDVIVRDRSDNRLAREMAPFRLGTPAGEVTEFTATPQFFKLGDDVRLKLKFRNSGSAPLAGTCVFRVMRDAGIVEELRQEMPVLKPGASKTFTQSWNTDGAEKGAAYYALGFVEFEGMASEPKSLMLSTNRFPTARFSPEPETTEAGVQVLFDATASADEDGTIEQFRWEFDDGARATDSITAHTFQLPGAYDVSLTVVDDEGGTGSIARTIVILEPPEGAEQEEEEEQKPEE